MPSKNDPPRAQTRAPEETRRDILVAAVAEFSEKGLAGARVDEIAAIP
jgi:AcrR family transcriptional regulator